MRVMKRLLIAIALLGSALADDDPSTLFAGKPEVISEGHQFAEGMAFDKNGNFYFTDVPAGKLFKVDKAGKKTLFDGDTGKTNGIAMGPDGMLYGCAGGAMAIHRWDLKTGKKTAIAKGAFSNDIAITKKGRIYFTDPKTAAVWTVSPAPEHKLEKAVQLEWKPNGIGLHPAQGTLMVADFFGNTIHGFPIGKDGALGESKPKYILDVSKEEGKWKDKGLLDGMVVLPSGRLLIGTARGIQFTSRIDIKDPMHLTIPPFDGRPRCNYVRISPDGKWVYAAFKDDLVKIQLKKALK